MLKVDIYQIYHLYERKTLIHKTFSYKQTLVKSYVFISLFRFRGRVGSEQSALFRWSTTKSVPFFFFFFCLRSSCRKQLMFLWDVCWSRCYGNVQVVCTNMPQAVLTVHWTLSNCDWKTFWKTWKTIYFNIKSSAFGMFFLTVLLFCHSPPLS